MAPQPFSEGQAEYIAVRNIRWHLVLATNSRVRSYSASSGQAIELRFMDHAGK